MAREAGNRNDATQCQPSILFSNLDHLLCCNLCLLRFIQLRQATEIDIDIQLMRLVIEVQLALVAILFTQKNALQTHRRDRFKHDDRDLGSVVVARHADRAVDFGSRGDARECLSQIPDRGMWRYPLYTKGDLRGQLGNVSTGGWGLHDEELQRIWGEGKCFKRAGDG